MVCRHARKDGPAEAKAQVREMHLQTKEHQGLSINARILWSSFSSSLHPSFLSFMRIELRASHSLGNQSTAMLYPSPFYFIWLQGLAKFPSLELAISASASHVAGIAGVRHRFQRALTGYLDFRL